MLAAPAPPKAADPPALPGFGPVASQSPIDPKLGSKSCRYSFRILQGGLGSPLIPSAIVRPPKPPTSEPPTRDPASKARPSQFPAAHWRLISNPSARLPPIATPPKTAVTAITGTPIVAAPTASPPTTRAPPAPRAPPLSKHQAMDEALSPKGSINNRG